MGMNKVDKHSERIGADSAHVGNCEVYFPKNVVEIAIPKDKQVELLALSKTGVCDKFPHPILLTGS